MEPLPAILLSGFDATGACVSLACGLAAHGFPIVALCPPGGAAAADSAQAAGYTVVVAEKAGALRAGLEYFHSNMAELPGAVWLDCGQGYSLADALAVAYVSAANPDAAVLADRAKSREAGRFAALERLAARLAFAAFHGRGVRDAWAGLMGLPARHIAGFLGEKGRGGPARLRLLLTMQRRGVRAVSVPVAAPFGRGDGETAKSRLIDIVRIVLVPLMFVASSLTLTGADYSMRFLFMYLIVRGNVPVSLAVGRFSGALTGYLINRSVVFRTPGGSWRGEAATLAKFAVLALCMYYAAYLLVSFWMREFGLPFPLASVITDVLLYAPNYFVQRDVVFRRK